MGRFLNYSWKNLDSLLKLPAASPPAMLIGGTFGGECARCLGSENNP
jgi:hypothetical protein